MEVARTTHPRRAVAGAVPIRLEIALTGEEYVTRRAWRYARAPECPWHRRSASWRRTAPTSAGGRQASACGGSSLSSI